MIKIEGRSRLNSIVAENVLHESLRYAMSVTSDWNINLNDGFYEGYIDIMATSDKVMGIPGLKWISFSLQEIIAD